MVISSFGPRRPPGARPVVTEATASHGPRLPDSAMLHRRRLDFFRVPSQVRGTFYRPVPRSGDGSLTKGQMRA